MNKKETATAVERLAKFRDALQTAVQQHGGLHAIRGSFGGGSSKEGLVITSDEGGRVGVRFKPQFSRSFNATGEFVCSLTHEDFFDRRRTHSYVSKDNGKLCTEKIVKAIVKKMKAANERANRAKAAEEKRAAVRAKRERIKADLGPDLPFSFSTNKDGTITIREMPVTIEQAKAIRDLLGGTRA